MKIGVYSLRMNIKVYGSRMKIEVYCSRMTKEDRGILFKDEYRGKRYIVQ